MPFDASRPDFTVAIEDITPAAAAEMLNGNWGNRRPRTGHVRTLAREMASGRWRLTHQGVCFAPDGRLLDGQHRLMAVVQSGATARMLVFRDWDDQAFEAIDIGIKRGLRDIMRMDARVSDVCAWLGRLHGADAVPPPMAKIVFKGIEAAITDLMAAANPPSKGRTASPIRAAAVLRIMQGHGDYVLPQWRALAVLDYPEMTPAVQALCRQMTDENRRPAGAAGASTTQNDRAARGWIAFDPDKADATRIQIKDVSNQLDEMRAVWKPEF